MTLNELITELKQEAAGGHGDKEISYEAGRNQLDILIGEDPDTGLSVTIKKPDW